jgi:mannose-6-phosphate isomerase-like protein (cupin superfamily)
MDIKTAAHYLWGDNCNSWLLADTDALSVKQERMPGGTKEKLHVHTNAQQFFFILKGTASFYLENEKYVMIENQGLLVSTKAPHFIANETAEEIVFLVISQPSINNDRTVVA